MITARDALTLLTRTLGGWLFARRAPVSPIREEFRASTLAVGGSVVAKVLVQTIWGRNSDPSKWSIRSSFRGCIGIVIVLLFLYVRSDT